VSKVDFIREQDTSKCSFAAQHLGTDMLALEYVVLPNPGMVR
jgi:hypothetical protein